MRVLRADLRTDSGPAVRAGASWVAATLFMLALSLRVFRIGDQSLWVDELLTIWQGRVEGYSLWRQFLDDAQNPLPMLLAAWVGRWRDNEAWLRLPSAIFGAASVPLLLRIGRRLGGERVGLFAALLLAVHPLHIQHSQEVRGYAAMLFFGLWTIDSTLAASPIPKPRQMFGIALTGVATILSNLSGLVWMAGLALGQLLSRRWNRSNAWHYGLVFATMLWATSHWWLLGASVHEGERLLPGVSTGEALRAGTTWSVWSIPYAALTLAFGSELGPSTAELHALGETTSALATLRPHLGMLGAAALVALIVGLAGLPAVRERRQQWWLWAALPVVFAIALAWRNVKPFNPRYVLAALPSLLLLWALGLDRLRRPLSLCLLLAWLSLDVVALERRWSDAAYQREDVRAAVREIEQREGEEDLILAPGVNRVVEYYYTGQSPIENLSPAQLASDDAVAGALSSMHPHLRYVWHVSARPWATDPEARVSQALASRFRGLARLELPGVRVQLYDRGAAPDSLALH